LTVAAPWVADDTIWSESAALLYQDFASFAARAFLELNPRTRFAMSWHVEVMAGSPPCVTAGSGG